MLACNWCGNWRDISNGGDPIYEFIGQSGYWSLFDVSQIKIPLKNGGEKEFSNWLKTGVIKSVLPLRDGRDYGIPLKTQITSFDTMICGAIRKMPNLPLETLFIMGNHSNKEYPCIEATLIPPKVFSSPEPEKNNSVTISQQTNSNNYINIEYQYVLYDIHLFTNEVESWGLSGDRRLFTYECFDYNLSQKELIENKAYQAEDIRRESNHSEYLRQADDDFVNPFDSPYYNDALDLDQQSPEFWDSI